MRKNAAHGGHCGLVVFRVQSLLSNVPQERPGPSVGYYIRTAFDGLQ
jgi:hypothetical protein